jgi:hypothetical protein
MVSCCEHGDEHSEYFKRRDISCTAERLLTCQGHCSMELVHVGYKA